jgi:multicomponent K+:H+ antiporter subunit G
MIQAPDLPLWAAIIVGLSVLLGGAITLVGALGLIRMDNFYDRVHPPTLGMTLGTAFILIASITCFSVLQSRPVVHEILIFLLILITTPVTLMLLGRASLYRDRREGAQDVPRDVGDARTGDPAE